MNLMLILFASDLHGNEHLYRQLFTLAVDYNPAMLILGGDLLPGNKGGMQLVSHQKSFISEYLSPFLGELSGSLSLETLLLQGNDDCLCLKKDIVAIQKRGLCTLIDQQLHSSPSGWYVAGFSLIPETPFMLKDLERKDNPSCTLTHPMDTAYSTSKGFLQEISVADWFESHESLPESLNRFAPLPDPAKTVFVSHSPPYGTALDVLYNGTHIGSRAIRRFIESHNPLISLHGHIHESYHMSGSFLDSIDGTVCFNPGQFHYPVLDALLVDTNDPATLHRHTGTGAPVTDEGFAPLKPPG